MKEIWRQFDPDYAKEGRRCRNQVTQNEQSIDESCYFKLNSHNSNMIFGTDSQVLVWIFESQETPMIEIKIPSNEGWTVITAELDEIQDYEYHIKALDRYPDEYGFICSECGERTYGF